MKHFTVWISVCVLSSALCAQTVIFSASDSASAPAETDSSIKLLKSSFSRSDVSAVYDGAPKIKSSSEQKKEEKQEQPQTKVRTFSDPASDFSSIGLLPANRLDVSLTPGGIAPDAFQAQPTILEQDIEQNNALIEKPVKTTQGVAPSATAASAVVPQQPSVTSSSAPVSAGQNRATTLSQDKQATAELNEAASRLAQSEKPKTSKTTRRSIPQAASKQRAVPAVKNSTKKPFNPNDFRPGVTWKRADSTHFIIYNQVRENGIGSANMNMIFEGAYETLRRNIPWMMSGKVRVFVYQDQESYQRYEPNAKDWTRALAYPTRGEIVVYDEPGKQQELKEVFTHELVHVFTQQFFGKNQPDRLMTPTWLDEGLAVFMEDQAYNGNKGGPWSNDLRVLDLVRSGEGRNNGSNGGFAKQNNFAKRNARKSKTVKLMPFEQFMREDSLSVMEARNKTQQWYLQAYAMVRFLLNPAGGMAPSNRMQFEQFTRLMAQGEQVRNPSTGFLAKDAQGRPVYQLYSADKALNKTYRYNDVDAFEDAFWRWIKTVH